MLTKSVSMEGVVEMSKEEGVVELDSLTKDYSITKVCRPPLPKNWIQVHVSYFEKKPQHLSCASIL